MLIWESTGESLLRRKLKLRMSARKGRVMLFLTKEKTESDRLRGRRDRNQERFKVRTRNWLRGRKIRDRSLKTFWFGQGKTVHERRIGGTKEGKKNYKGASVGPNYYFQEGVLGEDAINNCKLVNGIISSERERRSTADWERRERESPRQS